VPTSLDADSFDAFSLEAKRAVVTGSQSGLGRAITATFIAAGASVVGADITIEPELAGTTAEEGHSLLPLDLCDRSAIDQAVATSIELLGGIDICVNCAGIGGRSPAIEYPDELWDRVMATNVAGTFAMARAVAAHMIPRGSGSIVNIASVGGLVGFPGSVGYQASKGAVVQMTRSLAVEWGPYQVRVNAIAPGHIATELVRRQWLSEPELKEFFTARTPLGCLGEPVDIANAALFLASDAARMITGQVLSVDGGYTSH
jgi:NAD(P)-dependent dehydrogenase (short-subunit alcohol dehydrogenase family)